MVRKRSPKHGLLKVLIIGSLPPPLGGMSVTLACLVNNLAERCDVEISIVDTARIRGEGVVGVFRFLFKLFEITGKSWHCDIISLHLSPLAFWIMAPVVLPLAFVFRKPLIVRQLGGLGYWELEWPRRLISNMLVRNADLFLAETEALVQAAKQHGVSHTRRYPTNRPMCRLGEELPDKKGSCCRFGYIGHVRPYKGIQELIDAAERFGPNVSVDIYGPFFDGYSKEIFRPCRRVTYKRVLAPQEVVPTILHYDVMLLPTQAPAEGYPGAILEAYSAGKPVISTKSGAIPDIVDDTSGILIPQGTSDALYEAMKRLVEDDDLYQRLCEGAKQKGKSFSSEYWCDKFVEHCRELA